MFENNSNCLTNTKINFPNYEFLNFNKSYIMYILIVIHHLYFY